MQENWINNGWLFTADQADKSAQAVSYDASCWTSVILPHVPRIEKFDEPFPWQGVCWYRREILPAANWFGKRIVVRFEAAMQIADVWVNGIHAARHLGGYLPFSVDITEAAASGAPILLAVRLDNRDTDLVPPGKPTKGLDFNYPGGLYRGVKLIVQNLLHVSDPIEAGIVAGGGIFVQFSDVSDKSGAIHVQTGIRNSADKTARNVTVRQQLVDNASEQVVFEALSAPTIVPAHSHEHTRQEWTIANPRLWHPDRPNLYTLITTVFADGIEMDEVQTTVGIRSFVLENRVLINGQECRVVGSNRHQSYPYIEYALSPYASRRDAQRIADSGLNHIRLAHYPQDPAFLDACDKLGVLVQPAIPGWQQFHDNDSFIASSFQNIRDLIRRDRNHPSVIFWEPNLNETDGNHLDWCRTAHLIAHEEYPGQECYTFGDSYPSGWEPGWDVKDFVREYGDWGFGGNESTSRHTRGDGEAAMLQQAWNFQWTHNQHWASFEDPSKRFIGDATWVMFDYNRGYYPKPCTCGMMDIFRLPKYVYYLFQSQRDPKIRRADIESGPMVFIASDWAPRPSGGKVVVFSNCDEVELSLNGTVIARQKPDSGPDTDYSGRKADLSATVGQQTDSTGGNPFDGGNASHLAHPPFMFFDVPYAEGELTAVGYIDGEPIADFSVKTPGKVAKLDILFDDQRIPLVADGADTIFVRVLILDDSGTVVPVNELPGIRLTIDGDAELIGTDPIHVEAGIASVLLRAGTTPGLIRVIATAQPGIRPASASYSLEHASTV